MARRDHLSQAESHSLPPGSGEPSFFLNRVASGQSQQEKVELAVRGVLAG